MLQYGGAAAYGYLEFRAAEEPNGSIGKALAKVPAVANIGRAGTVAFILYALGKFGKVAPNITIPVAKGVAAVAAQRIGYRLGAGTNSTQSVASMSGDDDLVSLEGEIGDDEFLDG